MSYYTDKQYSQELPENAKKDLNVLFFKNSFKNSKRVLDIGCSLGRVISLDPKKIEGVDIDREALDIAKKKGFKVKYANVNNRLPFPNESFDAIYCSQVVEHLEEPIKLFKEIKRVLTKGGRAVVITPDYRVASKSKLNNFWEDYTHKRPFVKETLIRLSLEGGFKQIEVYHWPNKLFRQLLRRKMINKRFLIFIETSFPVLSRTNDLILEVVKPNF